MTKTLFTATAPDGSTHTRSTLRAYAYTVVAQRDFADEFHFASRVSATDASNYAYYNRVIALGHCPHQNRSTQYVSKEQIDIRAASDVADAVARLAGATTVTDYQLRLRDERIAKVRADKAAGAFGVWYNKGWCSRLDLAQKLQAKSNSSAIILEATAN